MGSVTAVAGDGQISFPYRIYNSEIARASQARLSPTQQLVAGCIYSRHHDGHVRQRACELIVKSPEPWVAPYVAYLAGEYVVEIIEVVNDALGNVVDSSLAAVYGAFAMSNPGLVDLIEQRATSYWSCCYRGRYTRDSYPGLTFVAALRQAAQLAV